MSLISAALFLVAAGTEPQTRSAAPVTSQAVSSLPDKPLAEFQAELLDLAFRAATAMPVHPHIKNRSRAQAAVVAACFELDQPRRALGYAERIDNWLRGAGYADYAFYCARHGDTAEAQRYLDLARDISDTDPSALSQDWRRDRIRARIAQTHVLLGETREADRLRAGLVQSEAGKVAAAEALVVGADGFDEQIKALEATVAVGQYDQMKTALETYTQLFDRFYDDRHRRSRVEEEIDSLTTLPLSIRFDALIALTGSALDHGDPDKALELLTDAQVLKDGVQWRPEDEIALIARLIGLRHRAGAEEQARAAADGALALFEAQRERIVDIYRPDALLPLAEAYRALGDTAAALKVYRKAVEESVVNVNSRPRAEDLSATCVSMALHAVEPDTDLWARMRAICDALDHPW